MDKNNGSEFSCENFRVRLDYNNMMSEYLGEKGFNLEDLDFEGIKVSNSIKDFKEKIDSRKLAWHDLLYNQDVIIDEIIHYAEEAKDKFDFFVVLGIGGSALGPMAVHNAFKSAYYNELEKEKRNGYPKFYVIDNVDPERLVSLFEVIEIEKTLFNCITKSGSTSETMSQFMIIKEMLKTYAVKDSNLHIVCTTDSEKGNLIKIAKSEGYKTFVIPDGVGGRFSVLSPVGLLPAAMCGIDIRSLIDGAKYMNEICRNEDIYQNPGYMLALLSYVGMKKGKNIIVLMPYADSLRLISDWFAQLWAESLGKKYDNDGNIVNVGQTPVKALGVTDQHSQLQLYTEGPFDKIIVFLKVEKFRETITVPKIYEEIPSLGFLGGVTHNELISVEQGSTEYALVKQGKMNMTITLPEVNEHTIGQVLYLFEIATGFMGELLNINAYDQPGVEEGKNAAYAFFGRPGYEQKKKELDLRIAKTDKYII